MMADFDWLPAVSPEEVADILGGPRTIGMDINDWRSAHEAIELGLPLECLNYLVNTNKAIAVDITDSYLRFRLDKTEAEIFTKPFRFTYTQSAQFWAIAEGILLATKVLGDRSTADRWLTTVIDEENGYAWIPLDVVGNMAGWRMFHRALAAKRILGE